MDRPGPWAGGMQAEKVEPTWRGRGYGGDTLPGALPLIRLCKHLAVRPRARLSLAEEGVERHLKTRFCMAPKLSKANAKGLVEKSSRVLQRGGHGLLGSCVDVLSHNGASVRPFLMTSTG